MGLFPSFCEQPKSDFMPHTAWVCEQQDTVEGAGYITEKLWGFAACCLQVFI